MCLTVKLCVIHGAYDHQRLLIVGESVFLEKVKNMLTRANVGFVQTIGYTQLWNDWKTWWESRRNWGGHTSKTAINMTRVVKNIPVYPHHVDAHPDLCVAFPGLIKYIYIYACMHVCTYIYIYVYVYICICIYMYMYIYVYVYVYIYIHMYMCIHMHIYIYRHIYILYTHIHLFHWNFPSQSMSKSTNLNQAKTQGRSPGCTKVHVRTISWNNPSSGKWIPQGQAWVESPKNGCHFLQISKSKMECLRENPAWQWVDIQHFCCYK